MSRKCEKGTDRWPSCTCLKYICVKTNLLNQAVYAKVNS